MTMRSLALLFFYLINFSSTAQPPPRHLERVAFDPVRNKLVVYGGAAVIDNHLTYFTNVHEWDTTRWTELEANGPGARNAAPLIFDPVSRTTLLFGGVFEDERGFKIYFDVWSWDGKKWSLINSQCPVKEPNVACDRRNKRILVYGEVTNKSSLAPETPREFELWEFKDNRWRKLSSEGPDEYSMMVFDDERNTLIIPSMEEDVAMWEWSNNKWKKTTCSGDCPEKRSRQAMVYHPAHNATYMFGGRDSSREFLGDFWKWDGIHWSRIVSIVGPEKRGSAQLTYANDVLLLYGGSLKGGLSNELWAWNGDAWSKSK
jgi:hypothetical protein